MSRVRVYDRNSPLRLMVRGYFYRCRMFNGADFEVWSPERLERKVAREALLAEANGDYGDVYEPRDVRSLWEARS